MLDWTRVQAALARAGYPCGAPDGQPGPRTWAALFAYAAGRPADAVLTALGVAAAKWLATDPIAATSARLAEFLAQTSHETGGYRAFEERLSYTAAGLLQTWPSRFTKAQAVACAGDPVEIACRVYGGRMGNHPAPAQDGWTYRGRGMLQLTGRDNYATYGKLIGAPLLAQPDMAADPAISLCVAREFWRLGNVNALVDRGDFRAARNATNGGSIGLVDVVNRRTRLLDILA